MATAARGREQVDIESQEAETGQDVWRGVRTHATVDFGSSRDFSGT
jgi:hypothetical protein